METPPTNRLFLLGAGFSRAAGLPLAVELRELVCEVAARHFRADGYSHLEDAFARYEKYLDDVAPRTPFDIESFGAWLDWEHTLRLKGSDTFAEHGNEAGLQLRWAIGNVLYGATPTVTPQLYLDFASQLTTSDRVLTLNYDTLLEQALDEVGLPHRRFPSRLSGVDDDHAAGADDPEELILFKLHGSIDWIYASNLDRSDATFRTRPLADGPRPADDPLAGVAVVEAADLPRYYGTPHNWYRFPPVLLPPSTAKPLASSALVPLWDGVGLFAYMLGGFCVIGCSLPAGDPYVLQLVHHVATDYVAGREMGDRVWPQRRIKVLDLQTDAAGRDAFLDRFRFADPAHTDFLLGGFSAAALDQLFDEPDLLPDA